jgi:hypothetical protein
MGTLKTLHASLSNIGDATRAAPIQYPLKNRARFGEFWMGQTSQRIIFIDKTQ